MTHKQNIQEIISIAIQNYDIKNHKEDFTPYTYTTLSGRTETIYVIELTQKPTFIKKIEEAKATIKDTAKWRVDVPSIEDLEDTKIFQTLNGGTFAIKKDGDIVNVCAKMGDEGYSLDNMESLMAYAVNECNGTKLDSFDGNWSFYRKCGFEPRTWIGFNEDIGKSLGWVKGRDLPEPVVFMEYTGNKKRLGKSEIRKERTDFYTKNKEITMDSAIEGEEYEYDVAYRVRDDMMKEDSKQKNIMPKYSTLLKVIEKSINKTHDGTSMGKLKGTINKFADKYSKELDGYAEIIDKNYKRVSDDIKYSDDFGRNKNNIPYDELDDVDNHIIKTRVPYTGYGNSVLNNFYDETHLKTFTSMPYDDMMEIMKKNDDGEYLFQSSTLISNNKSYMTLLRNNDFSEDDEKKFQSVCKEFRSDVENSDWAKQWKDTFRQIQEEDPSLFVHNDLDEVCSNRMREQTGYGTMREYLESRDYETKFKDCNVLFVMPKNK